MMKSGTLTHGGVMVNYQCNAACRHCTYSCSPSRHPGYVNEESAERICRDLRKGGCRSVHIGGGEPFLDFEGLLMMIQKLNKAGITLEYIETNAFWAAEADTKKVQEMLRRLLAEGGDCLCISIDPYHAEYVPYGAPLALAQICEKSRMNFFLWKREFYSALSKLDSKKAHSRSDMEKLMAKNYVYTTARQYGIGFGGRAVNIEKEYTNSFPIEKYTDDNSPCRNLLNTGHFHVDMNSNFIPPRCTGIRIPLSEAVEGIPQGKYLVFETLYNSGIAGLYSLARDQGFSPDSGGYPSKCNACFHIRHFLSGKEYPELDRNHYEEALKYY